MKRVLRAVSMVTLIFSCVVLMTGCGEKSAERKIGKEARYYTANKYGFRPMTMGVELRHVGEMEGVSHKKDGGTATMEYMGRTFNVYVSLTEPDIRYDDYLHADVDEYLNDYFAECLDCEDIYVWTTYGRPVCMVSGDVKTVEEIFEKCDNIKIYVSTYGLEKNSTENINVTMLGNNTEINIINWNSKDCLNDEELMRETVVGIESDSYTNGFGKVGWHKCFNGNDSE